MNDELRDFDLKSDEPSMPGGSGGSDKPRWPLAVAAVVLVLIIAGFFLFRKTETDSAPEASTPAVPAVSEPVATEDAETQLALGEVPLLVDSDPWLREVVGQISNHPQLAEWLVTPELIRGFVVVVDNVAEGLTPRKHLKMAAPTKKLTAGEVDGKVFIDPASYQRFDLLVDVIDSLDTEGTAELYRAIRPMCEQAYQDLGYPGDGFDATLNRAIQRVLAVPVVNGPIELESKVTAYQFADPALEDLSPAAKQFLRLGPDNLQRLQTKLRALSTAIGLDS